MQEKGIQMTLFEYFQDAECFSLKEAVACVEQVKEVKEPSIRARIYEGIEGAFFQDSQRSLYGYQRTGRRRGNLYAGSGKWQGFELFKR